MGGTVLQVVQSAGGWHLLDDGVPILWFLEKASAIETARVMADARHEFDCRPTCVQAQDESGAFELLWTFGYLPPAH